MIEVLITAIHITTALFMVLVVLLQGGSQGGVGASFGGGNSQGLFGATGATSFLGKLTYGAAIIFMTTSITLTIQQGKSGKVGLKERLSHGADPASTQTAPAATPVAIEEKKPVAAPAAADANQNPAPTAEKAPAATTGVAPDATGSEQKK